MYCDLKTSRRANFWVSIPLLITTALLAVACTGGKSKISVGNDSGTGADAFSNFKVLTFQGNTSTTWKTATASVWKTNLNTLTITGTCSRGISAVKVNQRVTGSSTSLVDSGSSANCVNGAYTWTKDYSTDADFIATSAGSSVQFDFNIFGLDGLGTHVVDAAAMTAVKFFKLSPTVLANIKYIKGFVQQTLTVLGTTTTITDNSDADTGATGHCPSSTAQFILGGTIDPEANIGVSGATSLNSNSGNTLSLMACVPFGSVSLVLYTKDESGSTVGSQYTVNVISAANLGTFAFASQGFKTQNLSPHLLTLLSQGINLVNTSIEQFGTATKNSTGATGYSVSVGLTSYTQQVSP